MILWDHCRICGLSLTETSLCGAYLYLAFKRPTVTHTKTCMKKTSLEVRSIHPVTPCIFRQKGYLTAFFKTRCIISVLLPTKCHVLHNFSFFGSNNIHVLHMGCTKI